MRRHLLALAGVFDRSESMSPRAAMRVGRILTACTIVAGAVAEVHFVGDCAEPRDIWSAIHDGARVGRAL